MIKKNLWIVMLSVAFAYFLFFIVLHKKQFTTVYNHSFFSHIYSNSPYVKGQLATEGIGDDGLYAFAGYYYLNGGDISQVNFENPPLGKYLIGLSIHFFGNQNIINLFYALVFLAGTFFLSYILVQSRLLASFTASFILLDPFFNTQLLFSLLDLPMAFFFLWGYCFYLLAIKHDQRFFWLTSVFFGLSISSKFFPGLIILVGVLVIDLFKNQFRCLRPFILSLSIIPIIYLGSHLSYFLYHPSLIEFLRYQKWIVFWRTGNPAVMGNIVTSLVFGRYRDWWAGGNWLVYQEWSPLIGFFTITGLLSFIFISRKDRVYWLTYLLVLFFFVYVFFGTVGYPKYILPIYPLMVILSLKSLRDTIITIRDTKI